MSVIMLSAYHITSSERDCSGVPNKFPKSHFDYPDLAQMPDIEPTTLVSVICCVDGLHLVTCSPFQSDSRLDPGIS